MASMLVVCDDLRTGSAHAERARTKVRDGQVANSPCTPPRVAVDGGTDALEVWMGVDDTAAAASARSTDAAT